jgi:hypothetical protein
MPEQAQTSPVFIVGAPRSGTTLLQYMLRSHPTLSVPTGESQFIIPMMRQSSTFVEPLAEDGVRQVLKAMYALNSEFLETDLEGLRFNIDVLARRFAAEGRATTRDVITGLFEANATGQGKTRWVDKTPYYVLHIPALRTWWPHAKFVHLIRDGRDVAMSLLDRRHDFRVYNLYFAARYWDQYVNIGHEVGSKLPADQYHELSYRELVREPRRTLERLCDFLEVDFDPAMLNFKPSGEAGKTPLLLAPVRADNAGKWRQRMNLRQLRTFEGGAASTLRRFGYELATSGKRLPLP